MTKIKTKLTPVRMPGGKSNALKYLDKYLIKTFSEYREPFFGGGSVGLYLMQFNKDAMYWVNEKFYPIYCFWKVLYNNPDEMITFLLSRREKYLVKHDKIRSKGVPSNSAKNARKLHELCRQVINDTINDKDEFHTACLWYILNKTSYSGMSMIGSYAPLAFDQNFTENCIKNLPITNKLMHSVKNVKFTNLDYSELLKSDGDHNDSCFLFCDPPYDIKDKLYGKNGDVHREFDHQKFAEDIKVCKMKWMITYNDNETINNWFKNYIKIHWNLQYTMKAAKRTGQKGSKETGKSGKKGKELLILNYDNNFKD